MKKLRKIDSIRLSWLKWVIIGLLFLPLAYISLKKLTDFSWTIILLAAFAYLLLLGLKTKIFTLKILFFNISAIFFALFLYECFLCLRNTLLTNGKTIHTLAQISEGYTSANPDLGYGSKKDGVFTAMKTINNELIYDVSYTIKDGIRYTPNSNEKSQNCVLFFGCSFVLGEGLSDTSTLPFFFNQYANNNYRVLNYGFEGYGPHQMLAIIENRVPKDIRFDKKKIAIYSFLPAHIARAAGYSQWDQKGPRYEIIDGSLRKVGTFTKLPGIIVNQLSYSYIYRRLFCEREPSHYDCMRTIEIIKKSNDILRKDSVIFCVFVWDNLKSLKEYFQNDYCYFLDEMKRNNIKTFFLHDAIGDYNEKMINYSLHKDDAHPNELANEKIAKYLYLQLKDY